MRITFSSVAAVIALAVAASLNAAPARAEERLNDTLEGYIHSVDPKAGTFVLGGKNERVTTFRFGVNAGEREAQVTLDGKRPESRDAAFKPGNKASVSSVTVAKVRWVTKMDVTTVAK